MYCLRVAAILDVETSIDLTVESERGGADTVTGIRLIGLLAGRFRRPYEHAVERFVFFGDGNKLRQAERWLAVRVNFQNARVGSDWYRSGRHNYWSLWCFDHAYPFLFCFFV